MGGGWEVLVLVEEVLEVSVEVFCEVVFSVVGLLVLLIFFLVVCFFWINSKWFKGCVVGFLVEIVDEIELMLRLNVVLEFCFGIWEMLVLVEIIGVVFRVELKVMLLVWIIVVLILLWWRIFLYFVRMVIGNLDRELFGLDMVLFIKIRGGKFVLLEWFCLFCRLLVVKNNWGMDKE